MVMAPDPRTNDDELGPAVRFAASDVRRMLLAGILDSERRYEVLDGEIVQMQAHNPAHLRVKRYLLATAFAQLGENYWIDSEPSLYLEEDGDYTLPDIVIYPKSFEAHAVRGRDVLLLIEVADSTFKKDRVRKAEIYARHGVRDYWVVNAATLVTYQFRGPGRRGYEHETEIGPDATLTALLVPELALRAGDV